MLAVQMQFQLRPNCDGDGALATKPLDEGAAISAPIVCVAQSCPLGARIDTAIEMIAGHCKVGPKANWKRVLDGPTRRRDCAGRSTKPLPAKPTS
jgi:hypothetical protein